MDNATQWSVDRLAASNLLAALKLDASDDLIDIVARHFAEHRRSIASWTADRIRDAIFREMEESSMSLFAHRSEDWANGFGHAEQIIMTAQPKDLLNLDPAPARSKGQILRAMVRQARQAGH